MQTFDPFGRRAPYAPRTYLGWFDPGGVPRSLCYPDAHPKPNARTDTDSNSYANAEPDSNASAQTYGYTHPKSDSHRNALPNPHARSGERRQSDG